MTNYILSIATEAVKNHYYNLVIAASLPPLMYLLLKKGKQSKWREWIQRLLIKKAMKRAGKGKRVTMKSVAVWFIVLCGLGLVISILIKSSALGILSFCFGIMGIAILVLAKQNGE